MHSQLPPKNTLPVGHVSVADLPTATAKDAEKLPHLLITSVDKDPVPNIDAKTGASKKVCFITTEQPFVEVGFEKFKVVASDQADLKDPNLPSLKEVVEKYLIHEFSATGCGEDVIIDHADKLFSAVVPPVRFFGKGESVSNTLASGKAMVYCQKESQIEVRIALESTEIHDTYKIIYLAAVNGSENVSHSVMVDKVISFRDLPDALMKKTHADKGVTQIVETHKNKNYFYLKFSFDVVPASAEENQPTHQQKLFRELKSDHDKKIAALKSNSNKNATRSQPFFEKYFFGKSDARSGDAHVSAVRAGAPFGFANLSDTNFGVANNYSQMSVEDPNFDRSHYVVFTGRLRFVGTKAVMIRSGAVLKENTTAIDLAEQRELVEEQQAYLKRFAVNSAAADQKSFSAAVVKSNPEDQLEKIPAMILQHAEIILKDEKNDFYPRAKIIKKFLSDKRNLTAEFKLILHDCFYNRVVDAKTAFETLAAKTDVIRQIISAQLALYSSDVMSATGHAELTLPVEMTQLAQCLSGLLAATSKPKGNENTATPVEQSVQRVHRLYEHVKKMYEQNHQASQISLFEWQAMMTVKTFLDPIPGRSPTRTVLLFDVLANFFFNRNNSETASDDLQALMSEKKLLARIAEFNIANTPGYHQVLPFLLRTISQDMWKEGIFIVCVDYQICNWFVEKLNGEVTRPFETIPAENAPKSFRLTAQKVTFNDNRESGVFVYSGKRVSTIFPNLEARTRVVFGSNSKGFSLFKPSKNAANKNTAANANVANANNTAANIASSKK